MSPPITVPSTARGDPALMGQIYDTALGREEQDPDGSYRMCTNYRHVNQLIYQDCYSLSRIDNFIYQLEEAKHVTKIDLLRDYHQLQRAKLISVLVTSDD
ncbi:hypothetical protein O3P69_001736 [Scylla paramamosain]|uniref:Uncharacterized protein n=1 Tax=Scylla paramamosain TaxID=85552 RepID=A0AAW0V3F5_SCYPA